MNWLAELLPLFFIRWYAHLYIQRQTYGDELVMHVRPGVFIEVRRGTRCPLCKHVMDEHRFESRGAA